MRVRGSRALAAALAEEELPWAGAAVELEASWYRSSARGTPASTSMTVPGSCMLSSPKPALMLRVGVAGDLGRQCAGDPPGVPPAGKEGLQKATTDNIGAAQCS